MRRLDSIVFLSLGLAFSLRIAPVYGQGSFTIQIGSPGSAPLSLVAHSDTWRYHQGTNAPLPGWQTNLDANLDATWQSGRGGFGYAGNSAEVANVQTPLLDMANGYSTLYIRRSFEITNNVDPAQLLQLVIDWDDGFVAWLDGVELSPRSNAPGLAGTEPPFNATATASHESSLGDNAPQPAMTFSLGTAGSRLTPGTHVLAIMGLNQALNSSDFILLADLLLARPDSGATISGTLLSVLSTNAVTVSGTNTIAGSSRVLVDGIDADLDPFTGQWSRSVSLAPGFNRLLFQVLDSAGVQLLATNRTVVAAVSNSFIGGPLTGNTALTSAMGAIHVTNSINVPAGATLSIGPGSVLLLSPGVNVNLTRATLNVNGTEAKPVLFAPADGTTVWGGLIGSGTGTQLSAQHLETVAGHIELLDGAEGIFDDSYFHDYTISSPAIIHTLGQPSHCALTLRGCHVRTYYEILCQLSTNRFEDCLIEYPGAGGDGIDFDAGQPGSVIRHCTIRHGRYTNVDALDMGEFSTGEPSRGVLIDSCLLYDFTDKGISMGVGVDVSVTNCLIHHFDSGIAVKDLSIAGIYNCTIVSNNFGFHSYNKANPSSPTGGGLITNSFNNIVWGNVQSFELLNGSTLSASYSDFQGTNVPGPGNLSLDPQWNAPAGADFTLSGASPLLTAGVGGASMGATFPVGAPMAASHPTISSIQIQDGSLVLKFWGDSEKDYSLLESDSPLAGNWRKVADFFPAPLPRKEAFTTQASAGLARFYRLVTPRQP